METFVKAALFIALIVFIGLLYSLPVMWLWNSCLIPAIPGLQTIGWIQAWGISILCNILFSDHNTVSDS